MQEQLTLNGENDFVSDTLKYDQFGCCHLYVKCSLSGKCLSEDQRSNSCLYRRHLEKGEVFYSSSSSKFDRAYFETMCQTYEELDDKDSFLQLVDYFARKKRMATSLFCLHSNKLKSVIVATSNLDIFNFSSNITKYTEHMLISELKDIISQAGLDTDKSIKKNSKTNISEAFKRYNRLADAVLKKYIHITFNSQKQVYIDEFFRKYINKPTTELIDVRCAKEKAT